MEGTARQRACARLRAAAVEPRPAYDGDRDEAVVKPYAAQTGGAGLVVATACRVCVADAAKPMAEATQRARRPRRAEIAAVG